ncbi:MAG: tetratricopeptide repeat protein [Planctomycetota bacterium]|jgi:tetratricopeptide (TPR) repeat protein
MSKKNISPSLLVVLTVFLVFFTAGGSFADVASDFEQARQYVKSGNYAQAEAIYKTIAANLSDPNNALRAQEKLTRLYVMIDRVADAQSAYQQLLGNFSTNPGIAQSVNLVAYAYRGKGQFAKALELYDYVLLTWPGSQDAMQAPRGIVTVKILQGEDAGVLPVVDTLLANYSGNNEIGRELYRTAKT